MVGGSPAVLHPVGSLSRALFAMAGPVCIVGRIDWKEAVVHEEWLSEQEAQRAGAFRSEEARRTFVLGRSIARAGLGLATGLDPGGIGIGLAEAGKPLAEAEGWHISISHSGPWVAVAFDRDEIGCDLELGLRLGGADLDGIARQVFSQAERMALVRIAPGSMARRAFFLEVWRRKEAVLKASGQGLSGSPRTLCLLDADGRFAARVAHAGLCYRVQDCAAPALPPVALAQVIARAAPTPEPAGSR